MLFEFPLSKRAPGRGRYERTEPTGARFREQRSRLLHATAIAHLEGVRSVTRVSALSGVGRNTFYECFDDFQHALDAARKEQFRRVQRALVSLSNSGATDCLAWLCRAWLAVIAEEPVSALVALEPERGQACSALHALFRDGLASCLLNEGPRSDRVVLYAAGCAEISARTLSLALLSASDSATPSTEGSREELLTQAVSDLTGSVRRLVMG